MSFRPTPFGARPLTVALGLGLTLLARPVLAGREPVLKQVKLPHPYYYREMYLPQVTSGPSAVDWSPDGREVVLSMQGSLWRLRLGTPVATQITDGPGYDFQPDWSPDGRFIAYASYRSDAVELRLFDLGTGTTRALTENGAVNVEPRFSPDGRGGRREAGAGRQGQRTGAEGGGPERHPQEPPGAPGLSIRRRAGGSGARRPASRRPTRCRTTRRP